MAKQKLEKLIRTSCGLISWRGHHVDVTPLGDPISIRRRESKYDAGKKDPIELIIEERLKEADAYHIIHTQIIFNSSERPDSYNYHFIWHFSYVEYLVQYYKLKN